jgi:hypothetical protein
MIQALNFPLAPLQLKKKNNEVWVRCLIRKKELLLTPEEWVRQHTVNALNVTGISLGKMMVENGLKYNVLSKRTDVIAVDDFGKPWLVVECKAPQVKLSTEVFQQWSSYQNVIQAPFGLLTNGIEHFLIDTILNNIEGFSAWPALMERLENHLSTLYNAQNEK